MSIFQYVSRFSIIGMLVISSSGLVQAESSINIDYVVSFARLPIGSARVTLTISETNFHFAMNGYTRGVARVFASGSISASASGDASNVIYRSVASLEGEPLEVSLKLEAGNVADLQAKPSRHPRVPLTRDHMSSVMDPLSAALLPRDTERHRSRAACNRTQPVFDGIQRYDLQFRYKESEVLTVGSDSFDATICIAAYRPIAGARMDAPFGSFFVGRDIEVAFIAVAGSPSFVPARVIVRSAFGNLVVQVINIASASHLLQ